MISFKEFQRRLAVLESLAGKSATFEGFIAAVEAEEDFWTPEEVMTGDIAQVTKPLLFMGRDLPDLSGYGPIKQRAIRFTTSNKNNYKGIFGKDADFALKRVARALDSLQDADSKED